MKRSPTTWYHGGPDLRTDFRGQRWDRDRTTSSLNEEGPGIYFTTKAEQAASYGPYLVQLQLPESFRVLPLRKPSMKALRQIYAEASPEQQALFLSNWGENAKPEDILRKYSHQTTLHDALVSLYGDMFQHDADAWISAVRTLGYHGVIVPKNYGVKHLIVWAPEEILGDVHEASLPEDNPGPEPPPDADDDALIAWVEAVAEHKAKGTQEIARRIRAALERGEVFSTPNAFPRNGHTVVHRSSKGRAPYQLTWLDDDGPVGDTEPPSIEAAAERVWEDLTSDQREDFAGAASNPREQVLAW